jgi:hypothetical protein
MGRINTVNRVNESLLKSYSNSLFKLDDKEGKKYEEDRFLKKTYVEHFDVDIKNESDGNLSHKEQEEGDDNEFLKEKIDDEIKNILNNRRNFILNTLVMENFSFDVGFHEKNSNKIRNVRIVDDMLAKIQQRKEKILNQKKMMQIKLEKVGIKIL